MKNSPQFLRKTLRNAHALQARYNALGAASTQNIRNPLPMHKLVLGVLPKLPDPDSIVPVTIETRFTFGGKSFVKKSKGFEYARDLVPRSQWDKQGKTVPDVISDLERLGYIVRNQSTVTHALVSAVVSRKAATIPQSRHHGQMGRSRSLYFTTK